ncbi:hypothetical protein [Aestuariispira insulae]|uniref:Uncharacterized protein n=1 Tax=Aestuariispira insulae TaxID=1461337 RepID=A0A3D9HSK8_9PROT|nr:hypothetical protein [Aestuariispira insulae]RED52331.1 hypothetical protein DFP90_102351 [Aestuariispira insulae]
MQVSRELITAMEQLIEAQIRRLSAEADICVFALYDPSANGTGPKDFACYDRKKCGRIDLDVDFEFEGVGVWYIAYREGDVFRSKKILLKIENGRFAHGQVGNFEGYWDEFPQYVAEDRWVQDQLGRDIANDMLH